MEDFEMMEEEKEGEITVLNGFGVVATTAAGVGVGLLGSALGVAALAAAEVVLPALLCLKAAGVVGGGVGFVIGLKAAKK